MIPTDDNVPIIERQPLPALTNQPHFQNRDTRFKSIREHVGTSTTAKRP